MNIEKRLVIINGIISSIASTLILIFITKYKLPDYFIGIYFSLQALTPILSSLFLSIIKIDNRNFLDLAYLGVLGPYISIVFFIDPNISNLLLSIFLLNFLSGFTLYSITIAKGTTKYYFYNAVSQSVGAFISFFLFNLNFLLYVSLISIVFSFIILIFSIEYFKIMITEFYDAVKKGYGVLYYVDKLNEYIKNVYSDEGMIKSFFDLKNIKLGKLEFFNFLILIAYSSIWTSIAVYVKNVGLMQIYLLATSMNLLSSGILYKLLENNKNTYLVKTGILIRSFLGILVLLFIFKIINISSYDFLVIFLLILASISWVFFQYIQDKIILEKYGYRLGSINLFRNIGGTIGPLISSFIGISISTMFAIFILMFALFLFNFEKV